MTQLHDILQVRPTIKDTPAKEARAKLIVEAKNDAVALSIYLLQDNPGLIKCETNIYLYNGKCYDLIDTDRLLKMIHEFLINYGITRAWSRRNDIVQSVLSYSGLTNIKKMNDYEDLMCLNNGILNIKTQELITHSPNYYFDSVINVEFDTTAKFNCPSFLKYLEHTFNSDKDTISNIIMLGGYLLDSSCKANKMFLFNGCGSNGKSVLLDTFRMFFTKTIIKPQVTALSLEELAGDGFKKADLITSRFNVCTEGKKGYVDSEEIKKIISGELISVRGIYKDTITFEPKSKIGVACNGLMKFNDTSEGIFRRMIIFNFENQYRTIEELKLIKHSEQKHIFVQDLDLPDKIKSEKSAILNLFLSGLVKLRERKYQFIVGEDYAKAINNYRRDSDTVHEFLEENYEVDEKSDTPLAEIYGHYRSWYRVNVQDSSNMKFRVNEMGRRIKEVFGLESKGQRKVYNNETMQYEHLNVYGLKRIIITPPDDFIDSAPVEEVPQGELGI